MRAHHLLLILATAACSQKAKYPMEARGVILSRTDGWTLENEVLKVRVRQDGAIVDLLVAGAESDLVREIRPLVSAGDKEIRLSIRAMRGVWVNGLPTLHLEHVSDAPRLSVVTEISLAPGAPRATVRTTAKNLGRHAVTGLRLGDAVDWPGGHAFAPGHGFVRFPQTEAVPFVAREGDARSYAIAFPDGDASVDFRFDPHGPAGQVALSAPRDVPAGASTTMTRHMVAVPGTVSEAAAAAWSALGTPLGTVEGQVKPAPSWAVVEAWVPSVGPISSTRPAPDGTFRLMLPAGEHDLIVIAPGGEDRETVRVTEADTAKIVLYPPSPGRLRYVITDAQGQTIPARIVVRGLAGTRDPNLGPEYLARGAGNVIHTARGEGEVEIARGRYRLTVTRGIEYTIDTRDVTIDPREGATVRPRLSRVVDTTGWVACDFHLHAAPSPDSQVSLEDRVVSLMAENVELAVATDHNRVTDYGPAVAALEAGPLIATGVGVEITTWDPQWGHFNAFPYPAELPPPPFSRTTPGEMFERLRAETPGALIQVNHPRMAPNIGYFDLTGADPEAGVFGPGYSPDYDTIEIWNGMDLGKPEVLARNLDDWYHLLDRGHRYVATGSSDSHKLIFEWVGYPRTYVKVDDDRPGSLSAEGVAASLKAGRALVTTGPFLDATIDGKGPGELVAAGKGTVVLEVAVRAAPWVDVTEIEAVVNGEPAVATSVPRARRGQVERLRWKVRIPLKEDAWILVLARGSETLDEILPWSKAMSAAFTNPIYVDADGDGVFTAPLAPRPAPPQGPDAEVSNE